MGKGQLGVTLNNTTQSILRRQTAAPTTTAPTTTAQTTRPSQPGAKPHGTSQPGGAKIQGATDLSVSTSAPSAKPGPRKAVRFNDQVEVQKFVQEKKLNYSAESFYNPRKMEDLVITNNPGLQVTSSTLPSLTQKNVKLANQAHPVTGIVFDQRGFPIFDNVAKFDIKIGSELSAIKQSDVHMKAATSNLREQILNKKIDTNLFSVQQMFDIMSGKAKIDGFIWHHHQDVGRMQLIPETLHKKTGHVGGSKMWFSK